MDSTAAARSPSSPLVLLFGLIEANDWKKLNSNFISDPEGAKVFQHLAALVAKSKSFNGMTILHACARFNPPSLLVSRMIELCPDAPSSRDCLNRTPLHVAAGTGASCTVLKVLVDAYPEACTIQDNDGRSPLHMACDSHCELFEDNGESSTRREAPSYRTIGVLLSGSLESAILEDEDGMSAIEYALCSSAELKTIRLLQKAAQKVRLNKYQEEQASKNEGKAPESTKTSAAAATTMKSVTQRRTFGAPMA
ncbi:hypothetical protein ACHAWF_009424 [Thalassiosira exigua]